MKKKSKQKQAKHNEKRRKSIDNEKIDEIKFLYPKKMSGNNIRQLLNGIKPVPSLHPNLKRRVENSGHSGNLTKNNEIVC